MMRVRSVGRDLALVCVAVVVGWWARGGDRAVLAQRSGSGVGSNLAFQIVGIGPESALALYNQDNRTLYVYTRAGAGSSTVNCSYSFTIGSPGAPLERKNCPVGELFPQH